MENTPRVWGKCPPKMNHTGKVSKVASNSNIAQRIVNASRKQCKQITIRWLDEMEIEMKLDSISYRGVAVEDLDFTTFP